MTSYRASVFVAMLLPFAPIHAQKAGALQQPKVACRLLTLDEVGKHSNAGAVEVDPKSSGEDAESNSSGCTWRVKGSQSPPIVILTIENGDTPGSAERLLGKAPVQGRVQWNFTMRKHEAFTAGPPAAVPGLGDEAFYRDFDRVKGGALLVRRGIWFVSFSGSIPKDGYLALARLVLQRM